MLMTDASGYRLSARNCLEGKVTRVSDGAVIKASHIILAVPA